ncbi:hypothetical protein TrLO_g1053 [Triparma laevis f. longispina]|uniref:DNA topoisomerase (ATP-hydrolyzing) n=1 Tax=Triparma laevis f. longispina TaxID=1714387 RepID=A0A9W7A507_9STRA|nr:hypothetical protein TrLO_g1053 [Triparma laevis f. longispina]
MKMTFAPSRVATVLLIYLLLLSQYALAFIPSIFTLRSSPNNNNKLTTPLYQSTETSEASSFYDAGPTNIIQLENEVQSSFMQYAMSIILGRALPDIRDGMKPVHRRILYAMSGLNLNPTGTHRKCARVVGEVLGKYHPHGDMAVYDALVRMAQDFSTGTPLIDGHGNFGSVDADPPAAMRYTEAKLTYVAVAALLDGVNDDGVVDFVDNFDGNEREPTVLPARLPFLLLNGAAGIAVGMATNIPPHNLGELVDACRAITKSREMGEREVTDEDLLSFIPGPDFPTGSMIMGREGSAKLYKTGHGGVVMRATCHVESKAGKKSKNSIVCTELPYQVNKATLLEKIAEMVNDKKIDGISDLRDESDRDGIRIVIELKRDAVPAVVQNNLFKKTPMQSSFSGNFLALMGGGTTPQRFTLRTALDSFLDFRFETVRRKAQFDLDKVEARDHIVDGLMKALEGIDFVIKTIREAEDSKAARSLLMEELVLGEKQADAVLKLQLGQLTRLNGDKLADEKANLVKDIEQLTNLMTDDTAVRNKISTELAELKSKYGRERRTRIEEEVTELGAIDLIKNSKSVIVVTAGGYVKRMPLSNFEAQQRGTRGKKGTSFVDGDFEAEEDGDEDPNVVEHCFSCQDHDTLLFSTISGVAYGLRAFQIPISGRTAKGVPLPSVLPISGDDDIASVLPISSFSADEYIVLTTEKGWIKKTPVKAFETMTSRGLIIASLEEGDRLRWCAKCTDEDDVFLGTNNGMATRYGADKLRPTSRTSRGVRGMKLRPTDKIVGMSVLSKKEADSPSSGLLAMTAKGYGKRIPTTEFRSQGRGGIGVIAIKFKPNSEGEHDDGLKCLTLVDEDDEIILVTKNGIIVRQKAGKIPSQSRSATGVRVQKVDIDKGDAIMSMSKIPKSLDGEDVDGGDGGEGGDGADDIDTILA